MPGLKKTGNKNFFKSYLLKDVDTTDYSNGDQCTPMTSELYTYQTNLQNYTLNRLILRICKKKFLYLHNTYMCDVKLLINTSFLYSLEIKQNYCITLL